MTNGLMSFTRYWDHRARSCIVGEEARLAPAASTDFRAGISLSQEEQTRVRIFKSKNENK